MSSHQRSSVSDMRLTETFHLGLILKRLQVGGGLTIDGDLVLIELE